MIDDKTLFFSEVSNFEKISKIPSYQIVKSKLDFTPKVTIAIPTFKRVNLLKETLDSAINQIGFINYDILVVDNDPLRGCETEKLLGNYNNVRLNYYKNSENLGMAGNWNRLFELAEGEFVVMLHDDDLILPTFLQEMMKYVIKNPKVGIVKPLIIPFSHSLTPDELNFYEKDSINFKGFKLLKSKRIYDIDNYEGYMLGAPTGCLFNRKAVLKVGGFNADYYPSIDYSFLILFSNYYKVVILKKKLVLYRWAANETLKLSVLKSFLFDAYYIRSAIFNKYKLPEYFKNIYLLYSVKKDIITWNSINSEFDFSVEEMGFSNVNKMQMSLSVKFTNLYMKIVKLLVHRSI
jgi:GT2 family glycosyltransferase